ncbi:MAG: hypothetical protein EOO01_33800 [Chitinophagaceae bacterium]|nr:MAG: hypothetical protein EOO01_33800 [Chitinophagaceae bacterium]
MKEDTVRIEASPTPAFKILKSGVEVSTICNGESVTLNNESNVVSLPCQNPTFSWSISPNTGVVYINGTNNTSQNPQLTFNTPGNYNITIKNGSDGNTLKDICEREIPQNEFIPVTVHPVSLTLMDSLTTPACAPDSLELVFSKKIRCSSIAPDGSDFIVNGTYAATVSAAAGNCNDGLTDRVVIRLASPMQSGGNFNVRLVRSAIDGNTLILHTLPRSVASWIRYNTCTTERMK